MESLTDPERLRDRDGVRFLEESRIVPQSEFESVVETADSHVAVGITDDDGAVLLENDGAHGWTLPAFVVDAGEDWAETARHGIDRLTDGPVELAAPELVRRVEFRPDGQERAGADPESRFRMYNVVVRAAAVDQESIAIDRSTERGSERNLEWFAEVPDEQEGAVADDIRLFLD